MKSHRKLGLCIKPLQTNKRLLVGVMVVLGVALMGPWAARVLADGYGAQSQVQSFFDGTTGFLVKTIGTGVFVLGLVVAGMKVATGDQNGMRSAVMVMVGGAVIFLSKSIVAIVSQYTGSN